MIIDTFGVDTTDWDTEEERTLVLGDHQRECDRVGGFAEPVHARSRSVFHGGQLLDDGAFGLEEVGPAVRLHTDPAGHGGRGQRVAHQPGPSQQLPLWPGPRSHPSLRRAQTHRRHLRPRRRRFRQARASLEPQGVPFLFNRCVWVLNLPFFFVFLLSNILDVRLWCCVCWKKDLEWVNALVVILR